MVTDSFQFSDRESSKHLEKSLGFAEPVEGKSGAERKDGLHCLDSVFPDLPMK